MLNPNPDEKLEHFKFRLKAKLVESFSLRGHMSLILATTALSGILSSRILHYCGVTNIAYRYPIAVVIAYAVLFFLIRIWLKFIFPSHSSNAATRSSNDGDSTLYNGVNFPDAGFGYSGTTPSNYSGGGGSSSGGGASGS